MPQPALAEHSLPRLITPDPVVNHGHVLPNDLSAASPDGQRTLFSSDLGFVSDDTDDCSVPEDAVVRAATLEDVFVLLTGEEAE